MNIQSPDNIYYNIRIGGDVLNNGIAEYEANVNNPIVDNPTDYYLAVTDFSAPGESIPINIARIVPNQANPDLMEAAISITARTFTGSGAGFDLSADQVTLIRNLEFISTSNLDPPVQGGSVQVVTPYYYVYSYQQILKSLNNAIIEIMGVLGWAEYFKSVYYIEQAKPRPVNIVYPYFYLDTTLSYPKISLIVPKEFYNIGMYKDDSGTDEILPDDTFGYISINQALINYLGGFMWDYEPQLNEGLEFQLVLPTLIKTIPTPIPLPSNLCNYFGQYVQLGQPDKTTDQIYENNFYRITQENYLLPQWNGLSKIVLYSKSLPIRNQQTSSKTVGNPDKVDKFPILFSFTPYYDTSSQQRNYIYYEPTNQYVLVDLLSTDPLCKIQLSVGWIDHNGEIAPLYLNKYQSCTVQLGFFKKSLYLK